MRRTLALLAVVGLAVGCGGDDSPSVERPPRAIPCPTDRGPGGQPLDQRRGTFDARELLGLSERQARATAKRAGCDVRVVVRDGEELFRTDDFDPRRINVAIRSGVVVAIDGVY